MADKLDLVIRGGTIADGSGADLYEADIGIRDGRIVEVGKVSTGGHEEVDARGQLVTPGFVDIHTHYDGQVTWSRQLNPNSHHGTTTVVMGNCGVGFAPCRTSDHEKLIALMEGVEDIPGPVLDAGVPWTWQTFPEYLNILDKSEYDMDIAAQLPHGPLRVYVMGQRGADREAATDEDIARMAQIATESISAGALGFTSSRSIYHKASDGTAAPTYQAADRELIGIALGVKAAGTGVLQLISEFDDMDAEFGLVRKLGQVSGRPVSFTVLQYLHCPDRWRELLGRIDEANKDGLSVRGQVCGRPLGCLFGLGVSYNPFSYHPSYTAIAHLPLNERVAAMRTPEVRARILSEVPTNVLQANIGSTLTTFDKMFDLGDPPVYEPTPDQSVHAIAQRRGMNPAELAYDMLLERDGKAILYIPAANYAEGTSAVMKEMLRNENTVLGLGDGGAHCGVICDASFPTYMLTRWAGEAGDSTFSLPNVVRALTSSTARAVGLNDRGVIAKGYRADLNVIDMDRLKLHLPHMVYDLPAGGGHLDQYADGYAATVVKGEITYREGRTTGKYPGRLVRGAQNAPV